MYRKTDNPTRPLVQGVSPWLVAQTAKAQPPEVGALKSVAGEQRQAMSQSNRRKAPPKRMDPYEDALTLLDDGRADQALAKLYEKLDRNPNHVPTYYTLGKIYANKGNFEEAQNWCERAIEKDKLHPEPYFTLSMIYQGHGLTNRAIEALKKTLYLDPTFVLAHYSLANLHLQQGNKDLAIKSFRNVQRLLAHKPLNEIVPEGDGLAVGRLLELVETALANGA